MRLCISRTYVATDPLTPPAAWIDQHRLEVSAEVIMAQTDALVSSGLLQSGYEEIGVDDGWQDCGAGVNGSFHDADGRPLVNKTRFPDVKGMVEKANSRGVKMGWYMNNCWCGEKRSTPNRTTVSQDIALVAGAGFSGLKVDGCGPNHNIDAWADAIAKSGKAIVMENCGDNNNGVAPSPKDSWSPPLPSDLDGDKCRWQLYRISKDIAPQFLSTMYNLQFTTLYNDPSLPSPLTRPGCWAYPDMLQVGRLDSVDEDRSHFAAWCIVSSPLVLGNDLTNKSVMDRVVPVVTNKRALRVSQTWAGSPGTLLRNSSKTFIAAANHGAGNSGHTMEVFPTFQIWKKPLTDNNSEVAVLVINLYNTTLPEGSAPVTLEELGMSGKDADVTEVWSGAMARVVDGKVAVGALKAHESFFAIVKETK